MAKSFDVQGYNFTGYGTNVFGTQVSRQELEILVSSGVNSIAIVPNFYMDAVTSNSVYRTEITPTDADLLAGIRAAQEAGLDILLKPHVDPLDGIWRAFLDPTDPAAWFASYQSMLVNYAKIAQEAGLKTMSIGTELVSMTGANYRAEWVDIIDAVREVFDGKLTYSAEWGEATTLSFWDELDIIGIDGYFPLSLKDESPSVSELKFSWMHPSTNEGISDKLGGLSPVDFLHDLSEQYGKKVMFTEIGFRPIEGAATSPGDWEMNGKFSEKAQTNLYKALFDVFGSQGGDWFSGFYIWDRRAENEEGPKDYHTEGRAAQKIINLWYGMDNEDLAAPDTGMTLYGSVHADTLVGGVGGTKILGGDGNDVLTGGDGADTLIGGRSLGSAGGTSVISLAAFGDVFRNEGATFDVLVNGEVVGSGEAGAGHDENWNLDRFTYTFNTPDAFQHLEIRFTNDDGNANKDRNLYVAGIEINGEAISLKDAENAQEPNTGALYANGSFTINLMPQNNQLSPEKSDADTLTGGLGADKLTGGIGQDIFVFRTAEEVFGDVINGFVSGVDKINLDTIDADVNAEGGQDFFWRGTSGLSGEAGDLAYRLKGGLTFVIGDTDGDGTSDFTLKLNGKVTLQERDFDL